MSTIVLDDEHLFGEETDTSRSWWLFLLTGLAWIVAAVVILRFTFTTVSAVSILFGVVAIATGVSQFVRIAFSSTGWGILHGLLGGLLIAIGVVAFIDPGGTFVSLAAIISFYFVFVGVFDIVMSIASSDLVSVWWVQLLAGIAEVILGFWAAGDWGRSVVLLVSWAGAICLVRGITDIVFGFQLQGAES